MVHSLQIKVVQRWGHNLWLRVPELRSLFASGCLDYSCPTSGWPTYYAIEDKEILGRFLRLALPRFSSASDKDS